MLTYLVQVNIHPFLRQAKRFAEGLFSLYNVEGVVKSHPKNAENRNVPLRYILNPQRRRGT